MILGAGISVSAGIPDFRAKSGLFQALKQKYPELQHGKDLFDYNAVFNVSITSSPHYRRGIHCGYEWAGGQVRPNHQQMYAEMIANLYEASDGACPTIFHQAMKCLDVLGRVLRVYTQNIDGLEAKAGLEEFRTFDGSPEDEARGRVALLHGSLGTLACSAKPRSHTLPLRKYLGDLQRGFLPSCPLCASQQPSNRLRPRLPGQLRPDITLYNDTASEDRSIALGKLIEEDMQTVDCVVVVGTSLKVDGFKKLVKGMSKACSLQTTLYVNLEPPPSNMKAHFKYYLPIAADSFARHLLKNLCT